MTSPCPLHYNHIHIQNKTVKRISTDWRHPRERTWHCVLSSSVAERSLCGRSGTCLGVLCEESAVWRLQKPGEAGTKAQRKPALTATELDTSAYCTSVSLGQCSGINQGGTAGFPVPLGIGFPAFFDAHGIKDHGAEEQRRNWKTVSERRRPGRNLQMCTLQMQIPSTQGGVEVERRNL